MGGERPCSCFKKMLIFTCQTARSELEPSTVLVTTSTRGRDGTRNRKIEK